MILDHFFVKYERGLKSTAPQKKLLSKNPALLGLKLTNKTYLELIKKNQPIYVINQKTLTERRP